MPNGRFVHLLYVCTGNICRSPTAERLSQAHCATTGNFRLDASSAGTRAVIGSPMQAEAESVLARLGGNSSNFTARQLTARVASGADLILAMTRAHRDAVLELAPQKLHRTFTLAEASRLISDHGVRTVADLAARRSSLTADESLDILDPIGQSPKVFAEIGSQIAHLLPPILEVCQNE